MGWATRGWGGKGHAPLPDNASGAKEKLCNVHRSPASLTQSYYYYDYFDYYGYYDYYY